MLGTRSELSEILRDARPGTIRPMALRIPRDPGDQPGPSAERPRRHLSPRIVAAVLGGGDLIALLFATVIFVLTSPFETSAWPPALLTVALFPPVAFLLGIYAPLRQGVSTMACVGVWIALGASVVLFCNAIEALTDAPFVAIDELSYLQWLAICAASLLAWRIWMKWRHAVWRANGRLTYRLAVIGMNTTALRLIGAIDRHGEPVGISVRRIFDDAPTGRVTDIRYGGDVQNLLTPAESCRIDGVVLALPWDDAEQIITISGQLRGLAADLWLLPEPGSPAELLPGTHLVPGARVLTLSPAPLRGWRGLLKRTEDIVLSGLILLISAPVMLGCAAVIAMTSRGPIMIRQVRFGYGNVPFQVLKFRTMYYDPADLSGMRPTVRGDKRVTPVGRFLRSSSLDELPQLLNVLRGDMSLIGPRPHPVDMLVNGQFYEEVVPHYLTRHRVKPGITGLAQINGYRGLVDTREKAAKRVEYDLFYIENWSLGLDIKILLQTLLKGFTGSGAF